MMKNYVVAYINFFDNNLLIKFVKAESKLDALVKIGCKSFTMGTRTIEGAKVNAFDADSMVEVKEVFMENFYE